MKFTLWHIRVNNYEDNSFQENLINMSAAHILCDDSNLRFL